jgi:hypothetical protein
MKLYQGFPQIDKISKETKIVKKQFALLPVFLKDGSLVWLEWVTRHYAIRRQRMWTNDFEWYCDYSERSQK